MFDQQDIKNMTFEAEFMARHVNIDLQKHGPKENISKLSLWTVKMHPDP